MAEICDFVARIQVGNIYEKFGQIFNNALCFSLYWPFIFFVFLTELVMVWPYYS